jgi:hypothetical protein
LLTIESGLVVDAAGQPGGAGGTLELKGGMPDFEFFFK